MNEGVIRTYAFPLGSYIIEDGICYLTLAEKTYPKKLAFAFLDDIKDGFIAELQADHGDE